MLRSPIVPDKSRVVCCGMSSYEAYLDGVGREAMDRCTSCGKCVEVCPTAAEIGLDRAAAVRIVEELKAVTAGEAYPENAGRWIEACNGSAQCVAACPEQINVRQWMSVARIKKRTGTVPESERRAAGAQKYRNMAHAMRLLASMQIPSEAMKRITARGEGRNCELLFYTGCNVLRTPHIVFNIMDILDVLGVRYDVMGGAANCCGIYQFNEGDTRTHERIAGRTYESFGQSGAGQVLTWCPTCTKQLAETRHDAAPRDFGIGHVTAFLAANIERMRPRFVDLPKRRAVLHEHDSLAGVTGHVRALMAAIPNLEVVEIPQHRDWGYTCQAGKVWPGKAAEIHELVAEGAASVGADLLVTTYHSCHRQLVGAEARYPFQVMNFTDLLAEALGKGGRHDWFKQYKLGGDMQQAVELARGYLQQNGVELRDEDVATLTAEVFGENGFNGERTAFEDALRQLATP